MFFDTNRIIILLLLLGLLYTMYRYQQQQEEESLKVSKKKKRKKKDKTKVKESSKKDKKEPDLISVDNVSQFSLGSLDDVPNSEVYKQDSMLNSIDSNSFEDQSDNSFFFQQK